MVHSIEASFPATKVPIYFLGSITPEVKTTAKQPRHDCDPSLNFPNSYSNVRPIKIIYKYRKPGILFNKRHYF